MKKLLLGFITLSGISQMYASQAEVQSQSTSSASGGAALATLSTPARVLAQSSSNPLTATQGIEMLEKLDKYVKADAVRKFLGREANEYMQEQLKVNSKTALKLLYIKKHLIELIPAVMPYPCIDALHSALKRTLECLKNNKETEIYLDEDAQNKKYNLTGGHGPGECVSLGEGSNTIIIQRWRVADGSPYPRIIMEFNNDRKTGRCPYYELISEHNLPKFDEGRKAYVSLAWIHPSKINQLANCTMEQLEFMVNLYHTQDPRIQKNTKRPIVFKSGSDHERMFYSLSEQLQKNLKVQYPLITTPTERALHSLYYLYRVHRIKLICTLALAGAVYSYCKWVHDPLKNWISRILA